MYKNNSLRDYKIRRSFWWGVVKGVILPFIWAYRFARAAIRLLAFVAAIMLTPLFILTAILRKRNVIGIVLALSAVTPVVYA